MPLSVTLAQLDRDYGLTGLIVPGSGAPFQGQDASVVGTANRLYAARFVPSRPMAITKIGFVTSNAATNNDNCDVGIYSGDGTTKLGSAGSTAGLLNATAGYQSANLTATVNLSAGVVYFAAFAYGAVGGTAATIRSTSFTNAIASAFGTAPPSVLSGFLAASFPLPSSIATLGATGTVPFLFVRES